MSGGEPELTFAAVTKDRLADFEALFGAPGGPKYCWCMTWRATPQEVRNPTGAQRKAQMIARIETGQPVGLLAYEGSAPVAWVSIAPRDTYRGLGGPEAAPAENVWSLTCMFVKRPLRGKGLSPRLIGAAVDYARSRGATSVEAYPVAPDSPSYRFMGFVAVFERMGFVSCGMAGTRRHVMRLPF